MSLRDCRGVADEVLRATCIQAGMSNLRAWWVWKGVQVGGAGAAGEPKEILTAP